MQYDNKSNLLTNKEDFNQYKTKYFTPKGYEAFQNYLKELILLYFKSQNNSISFPYKLSPVFGIPFFEYAHMLTSADELLGKIKGYGQLLGIIEVSFEVGNNRFNFNMNNEFRVNENEKEKSE